MSNLERIELEPGVVRGQWWHHLPDGRIQCDLCPRFCKLREGQQALAAGIRHVYTGNVSNIRGQSTCCARCGQLLIERIGYQLGQWNLDETGCCKFCGARLAGHFGDSPGRWGARRRRLFINA